ncbi:insulinase family protein [Amycolatopsis panacis]|uniref:Insulinase family protein n=1 Tax=Amycolatopsis panacis TaxID=2340917 RepID=A0A419I277_9PSEU|nr:insulinase family protein [Amycolatopsis panacis]RJQ83954.1 insulinase family protein [Amycolatopsis panacis]
MLRDARKAVLVVEPGEVRTRPEPVRAAPLAVANPSRPTAAELATTPEGPRQPPLPGIQPEPRVAGLADVRLDNGLRVVAVRDARAPLVELRLRMPLGAGGWGRAAEVATLVHKLGEAAVRVRAPGGELRVSSDGQWLDVTGHVESSEADGWLAASAEVLTYDGYGELSPLRDAGQDIEQALRRACLPESGGLADPRRILSPAGATLIAVGDLDPDGFAGRAASSFAAWMGASEPKSSARLTPGRLVLPAVHASEVYLTLCWPEPAGDSGDPARYLATAVFGGYQRSRLAARWAELGAGFEVLTGRELFLDFERVYLKARMPKELAVAAVSAIEAELGRMAGKPLTPSEVEPARGFCSGQLLGVFDAPSTMADLLRQSVASGREPTWLERMPSRLATVSVDDVSKAGEDLFAPRPMLVAVAGEVDEPLGQRLAMLESRR